MTQVKEWNNDQLNRKLVEIQGWKYLWSDAYGVEWWEPTDGRRKARVPNYAGDTAISLEIEKAAMKESADYYILHLAEIVAPNSPNDWNIKTIAALLSATPRERAEAAYITLSSKQ